MPVEYVLAEIEELLPPPPPGNEWIPVGLGNSGDKVYRRSDGAAYAKLCSGARIEYLDGERQRIAWLAQHHLGAPAVLDWITSHDRACLVTSTVPGVPASELSLTDLEGAWPSIAGKIKALHQLPVAACPFERKLAAMIDRAEELVARSAASPASLVVEGQHISPVSLVTQLRAEFSQRLAQERGDLVVCHGDACLPNFMVDPETLRCTGMVDLGRLGVADRYADLALLLGSARRKWTDPGDGAEARDRLFQALRIPVPDRGRLSFYVRLDPLTWG